MLDSIIVKYPQKAIAEAFGYKGINLADLSTAMKKKYKDDNREPCMFCGRVHSVGFFDKRKTLVSENSNAMYDCAVPTSDFICEYCYFNNKNYMKNQNGSHDMADILLTESGYKGLDLRRGNKDSELYQIFTNPLALPYLLMIREKRGNATVEMSSMAKPTVSEDVITVNYGTRVFYCNRKKVLACLRESEEIYARHRTSKMKVPDDVLFNSNQDLGYNITSFTSKLRADRAFMKDFSSFLNKYDEGTRFVSKIIRQTYLEKNKD